MAVADSDDDHSHRDVRKGKSRTTLLRKDMPLNDLHYRPLGDDADGTGEGAPEHGLDLDGLTEGGCVDHQAVADVHADVPEVLEEEHKVARLQLAPRDVLALVVLVTGVVLE